MKPTGFDDWTEKAQKTYAIELFQSERGRLIIGQALSIAANVLRTRDPFPEESNAQDAEVLALLFPMGAMLEAMRTPEIKEA